MGLDWVNLYLPDFHPWPSWRQVWYLSCFWLSGNFCDCYHLLKIIKSCFCDWIYKNPQGCFLSHPVNLCMFKWLKCSPTVIFLNSDWYCITTECAVPPHPSISSDVIDVWLCMDSNSSHLYLMCIHFCTSAWDRLELHHLLKWSEKDRPVLWVFPLCFHPLQFGHHPRCT